MDFEAPPSLSRGHRHEIQWGSDFVSQCDSASLVQHHAPQQTSLMAHESSSVLASVANSSVNVVAWGDECKLGATALSIDTSPPQLSGCLLFKKRPSPPLTSPTAVKSSLAQKKKRPAPLLLPDAVAAEKLVSPPSTVLVGPTLSTVDLNELALEDIIYEGHSVYGIQSIKGRRRYMEDTYCAYENIDGEGSEAYFGVFDGHGGRKAADFAAQNLYNYMATDALFGTNVAEAVGKAFRKADETFVELAEREQLRDGTTAVAAYIRGDKLWVANVGDSRAVLCRQGVAVPMSEDHRPNIESEQARIERNGGTVLHIGSWRVEGVLAVTRAIGDKDLKKCVTADPHIKELELQSDDELLVLASDGLWDFMSNQEVVDQARQHPDPSVAAKALVDEALARGSGDNITVLVVNVAEYVAGSVSSPQIESEHTDDSEPGLEISTESDGDIDNQDSGIDAELE